jgi:hypothetical protein
MLLARGANLPELARLGFGRGGRFFVRGKVAAITVLRRWLVEPPLCGGRCYDDDSSERTVKQPAELRVLAESKRRMADLARRAGPGLSLARDRVMMLQHAQELEAEAAELEAQAAALEDPKPQ